MSAAGPEAAASTEDLDALADHPAARRLVSAGNLAVLGDHLSARRELADVAADPAAPDPIRHEAAEFRRELGPDPLSVVFGVVAFAVVVAVWVLSLPQ